MAGYPSLVEPLIPDAQKNKSPEILLEGMKTGLGFGAQMAQNRRRNEMDLMELAQRERLQQEAHDIQRERLKQDYELSSALNTAHINAYNAAADLNDQRRIELLKGFGTAAQRKRFRDAQNDKVTMAFNRDFQANRLDDAEYAATSPLDYAKNFVNVYDRWVMAKGQNKAVKDGLGQAQTWANQHRIHMRAIDRTDPASPKAIGTGKEVPLYQIYLRLADDGTRDETMESLRINGHLGERPTGKTRLAPGKWNKFLDTMGWGGERVPIMESDKPLDAATKKLMDARERGLQFQHSRSAVPPGALSTGSIYDEEPASRPASTPAPTEEEALPTSETGDETATGDAPQLYKPIADISQIYPPTEVDRHVALARRAIRLGAKPEDVYARFQDELGLDPALIRMTNSSLLTDNTEVPMRSGRRPRSMGELEREVMNFRPKEKIPLGVPYRPEPARRLRPIMAERNVPREVIDESMAGQPHERDVYETDLARLPRRDDGLFRFHLWDGETRWAAPTQIRRSNAGDGTLDVDFGEGLRRRFWADGKEVHPEYAPPFQPPDYQSL